MRQIEKLTLCAIERRQNWRRANMAVSIVGGCAFVFLHDNLICCQDLATGRRVYSCAGWHTVTTASRLRALGLACHIKNGRIFDASGAVVPSVLPAL